MSRSWRNPPPVVVVSGGQEYLRSREVGLAIREAVAAGRGVSRVASGDAGALFDAMSGSFLFADAVLLIVESGAVKKKATKKSGKVAQDDGGAGDGWGDEAVALVVEHVGASDTGVSILVHHPGEVDAASLAGKVLEVLPKGRHASYPAPKPWEEKDYAVKFFETEVRRRGKTVASALAEAVVRQVGVDCGLLSFEALKVSTLLDVEGRTEVTKSDLTGMLASFGAEDWQALKEALALRNPKGVARALSDIRNGPGGDAYGKASIIVTQTVLKWLHAAALHEAGVSEEEAAGRVGMHPFPYKKDLLPPAKRWGKKLLTSLLRDVTSLGVRRGMQAPWVALESTLVLACEQGR